MKQTLLILNGPAYGADETFNALRLAVSLSRRDDAEVKLFLMGDAVVAGMASMAGGVIMNAMALPEDAPLHSEVGLIKRIIVLAIMFPALMALGHRLRRLDAERALEALDSDASATR